MRYYAQTSHAVRAGQPALAVVNTTASPIYCLRFLVFTAKPSTARLRIVRYNEAAEDGTLVVSYPMADGGAAAAFEARSGDVGAEITVQGASTLIMDVTVLTADGQGKGGLTPCEINSCSIAPGHSMVLYLLDDDPEPYVLGAHVEV